MEPPILDDIPQSAAVKKLVSGGAGGTTREQSTFSNKWSFSTEKEAKMHKNDNAPGKKVETYRIVDLTAMEETMNTMLSCNCQKHEEIDDFVDFCLENDSGLCETKLKCLAHRWKGRKDMKDEKYKSNSKSGIKIRTEQIGICTKTYLCCEKCMSEHAVKTKQSTKFKGRAYDGGFNNHDKAIFYEQNIKVVLGTIAAGIGPKDVETLFSFLGIPMPSSFPYVTFPKIENVIGPTLINVSEKSQLEALKKEVKAETGQDYGELMTKDEKIGIMGSYDMGWNKRSSGHRYDSISGHAFLISYHCQKVIATKVTSKKCSTCERMGEGMDSYKPHQCPLNHDGSSKGMEAEAALQK